MIESDQKTSSDPHLLDDEIDLRELFNVIKEGKKLIILITAIFAISSVAYSLMLANQYLSESVLMARESQDSGPFGLSQMGGLASMAGLSLPSSSTNGTIEVMEIIKSRKFVDHLMTFENVLPSLMAAKSYDAVSKELFFDPEIYDAKTKTWTREVSNNSGSKPSYLETHKKYLESILSISQDKKTGLISIAVEHISPIFAKDFLTLIIKEANSLKREKDIDTSSKALNYLKIELSSTPLLEMKESINQLIESQLKTQMMAKIHEEYSLVVLEPPFIPERKSKPSRSNIVVLSTILGGLLSVMIVLVLHRFRPREIDKHTIVD